MDINVNDTFILGADTYNFTVFKQKIIQKGKGKGNTAITRRAYFPNPEQAFEYLKDQGLVESDAVTLKELLTVLDVTKKELKTVIEDNILTIVDFKDEKESYGIELQKIIKMERTIAAFRRNIENNITRLETKIDAGGDFNYLSAQTDILYEILETEGIQ